MVYRRLGVVWLLACGTWLAGPALADEGHAEHCLVVDTDMGLDDIVTLALVLQNPDVDLHAVVACAGASSPAGGIECIERMLDLFNRRDVAVHEPAPSSDRPAPPYRGYAEKALRQALPASVTPWHKPFSPDVYVDIDVDHHTTVLALGPLTNLAAALRERPEIAERIEEIIIPGPPSAEASGNARFDPAAFAAVLKSGVPLAFVESAGQAGKPAAWAEPNRRIGQGTSIAETFLQRLFVNADVRNHYVREYDTFYDELAFLHCVGPQVFSEVTRERASEGELHVCRPRSREAVLKLLMELLDNGRQHKDRVVFAEGPLPASMFAPDVRARQAAIIEKNGENEWFAQLLMNELHEHMGAYSVVGVKMGLRAAELLNAPQHGMMVVAHTPPGPPVSCLNDGVIMATGCTPGRCLFRHEPGEDGRVAVTFSYNDGELTLVLKPEYRKRVREVIQGLLKEHTLEDKEYWDGVRVLGLDIWENWHRRDLFDIEPGA
ncbi:MAG: nucleoside hydrolase [Phycisphaerae bacterium]|jgi:inosine-uridine nucleoside N-ribohydrolase